MFSDVPLTGSVDLQARRIDDDMSWSIRGPYTQSDVDGALPSAHRAVVGHWEVESHERHGGLKEPLTCRLSSDHRLLENSASRHG